MSQSITANTGELKWREVFSLAALNAAVVISWIAYHEYQPILIRNFNLSELSEFLVITKAIVLVTIPPISGWLADRIMQKNGKFFIVFTVGIGATAMIFMVVATIIGAGPLSAIKTALPLMIVFWLIAMNLFISPANSMIEAFAPAQKLPVVMGVLFLVTELIYAMEPVVVDLVQFFGDTMTFVVGGILIAGTGILFHNISSDEVVARKKELLKLPKTELSISGFVAIIIVGLQLGFGKAILVEFLPDNLSVRFPSMEGSAEILAFGLLGFAAILAFFAGQMIQNSRLDRVLIIGFIIQFIGIFLIIFSPNLYLTIAGAVITAGAFSFVNVSGLPFAINHLSVRHITYGVGIFIGAAEVATGIMEYYLHE